MNPRYRYAREKLLGSIQVLATLPGDVRSRLLSAYAGFHPLKEDDFPDKLKKDWGWIEKSLTRCGPVYDHKGEVAVGSIENTLKRMQNRTGKKIAERLFNLFCELYFNEEYL